MEWWYRKGSAALRMVLEPYWPMVLEGTENLPAAGGVLLAGNHPTVLDGGMLGVHCPRRPKFLIDAKVLRLPVLGPFLRGLGSIPVERGSGSLRHAAAALAQGACIGIYPEAVPTGRMELAEFKRGVAVLAQQVPGVPVVPVGIVGSQPLCSHHHLYAQPGPLALRFGPALHWQEDDTIESFLARLRQAIEMLLGQPLKHRYRWRPATIGSAAMFVPPSAALLALSRRRFRLD